MSWAAGFIIVLMLGFAVFSAIREVAFYRKALKGEVRFLISKARLSRRLSVSGLLICESILLAIGFFRLKTTSPLQLLIFWIIPLIVILLVVYLALRDFRQTRRDIDKIFLETARSAIQKARERKS